MPDEQPLVAANGVEVLSPRLWGALEAMVDARIKSAFASALADPDVNPVAKSIAGQQTAKKGKRS